MSPAVLCHRFLPDVTFIIVRTLGLVSSALSARYMLHFRQPSRLCCGHFRGPRLLKRNVFIALVWAVKSPSFEGWHQSGFSEFADALGPFLSCVGGSASPQPCAPWGSSDCIRTRGAATAPGGRCCPPPPKLPTHVFSPGTRCLSPAGRSWGRWPSVRVTVCDGPLTFLHRRDGVRVQRQRGGGGGRP